MGLVLRSWSVSWTPGSYLKELPDPFSPLALRTLLEGRERASFTLEFRFTDGQRIFIRHQEPGIGVLDCWVADNPMLYQNTALCFCPSADQLTTMILQLLSDAVRGLRSYADRLAAGYQHQLSV